MSGIEVVTRALPLVAPQELLPVVVLDLSGRKTTVADLIQQTVEEQVRELQRKQAMKSEEAYRIIERQYLTSSDIAAQASEGIISLSRKRQEGPLRGEVADAVRHAWRAFEQRAYLVIIAGKIARSLEEELILRPDSKITFLRLVPLVGG
ncbi:MAG TPA: hypothetical protein VKV19_13610 [Ktedonobacteraceae bacterium]|nr:hypothetical protein [Ktedonobacteraceae bacterium]